MLAYSGVPVYVSLISSTIVVPVTSDNRGGLVLPVSAPLPAHLLGTTFYAQLAWLNNPACPGTGLLSSSDSVEFTLR